MLRTFLLITYRTLLRNREYSFINICGLGASIASCLLLFYIIKYELSYDTFHVDRDRIFRITSETNRPEGMEYGMGIPRPLPDALRVDFPQFEQVATVYGMPDCQIDVLDAVGNQIQHQEDRGVFFIEPQFFKMFSFTWLHGAPDVLNDPNVAVLTKSIAEKYFGDWRTSIGKTIEYRNTDLLKVVGVLEDIPTNSDFPLKIVISWATRGQETQGWGSVSARRQLYVMLDEHTSAEQIQNLMPAFEKKNHPQDGDLYDNYRLQPLEDIHFDERYGNYSGRVMSKQTLFSLALIGVLLIITASINFVNLAVAHVMKRSKEVGVRKVMGSNRWQLSGQFFGETFIILTLASVLSVIMTKTALPILRTLLDLPAGLHATDPQQTFLFLVTIVVILTILSGFYPAHVLTRFNPLQALKSKLSQHSIGGVGMRKGLMMVQFAIAQMLVIATLVVVQQLDFFHSASLGFNKDSIVLFQLPVDSANQTKLDAFRTALLGQSGIESVSFGFNAAMSGPYRRVTFSFNNATEDAPFEMHVKFADAQYFDTYDLELVAGRIYQQSDTAREYVVNEAFLEKFGITKPEDGLGKTITRGGVTLPIVGVVKDFHQVSLQKKIEPLALMCYKPEYRYASVKIQNNDLKSIVGRVKEAYSNFFPETIFGFSFFDDNVAQQYAQEERLSSITKVFSGIAVFISALGLYGLISFMAVQRTKEVGIRKVLGASMRDIVVLFCKEFILLVVIAFVVSAPLSGYFMSDWLNTFAYRMEISPWIFIAAFIFSLIVSLAVITYRSIAAALANPVESLRNE
jgi:putative ABC transport system permease protein